MPKHAQVKLPVIVKKCYILAAPAEIRLAIYDKIAPRCFLPHTNHKDYLGLFLSCKQIRREMEIETLRAAPKGLHHMQEEGVDTLFKIRSLRPQDPLNFGSLMHLYVGIPRWALCKAKALITVLNSMAPLFQLHLSSLTIAIEGLACPNDIRLLVKNLNFIARSRYLEAYNNRHQSSITEATKFQYYDIRTTYADIVMLATFMNCLVAPQLCDGDHVTGNRWCARSKGLKVVSVNVRNISLSLKKLHEEVTCGHCGGPPHDVYPIKSFRLRWNPTDEACRLYKNGWHIQWFDEHGVGKLFSKQDPARFVWRKRRGKQDGGMKKLMKKLLKL